MAKSLKQLSGLIGYEFAMSARRAGLWVAYAIIFLFFALGLNTTSGEGLVDMLNGRAVLQEAAEMVYLLNMPVVLVAGILASDRLQRDIRLNLRELQSSAPLAGWMYILGKYLGVLLSILLPALACVLMQGLTVIIIRQASPLFLLAELVAFLAISLPAIAFVTAFSLACPLILPLRVYQILFTGYWLWGNYLENRIIPTISDTLLNASGIYAMQGFFHGQPFNQGLQVPSMPLYAWINIVILCLCAACALTFTHRYFAWQVEHA